LVYEDGKQRRWTGPYGGDQEPHRVVAPVKKKNLLLLVGVEVFTAVVMKSITFWDMTPCSLLSANRRFGGTYRLHLQGRRNKFFLEFNIAHLFYKCLPGIFFLRILP
jgi:hypothetical protein